MTSTPQLDHHASYFDHRTTNIIKGVALILMFVHHFFTFPDSLIEGISYPWMEGFSEIFREPTKICVSVFAFLTGYLYYFQSQKTFRYSLKKIGDVLIPYWIVFFILLPIRVAVKQEFVLGKAIMEFFTLRSAVMVFCWYVQFYCLTMLILPVLTKFLPQTSKFMSFFNGLIVPVVLCRILRYHTDIYLLQHAADMLQQWFPCVAVGYLFALHNLFPHWLDPVFSVGKRKWGQRLIWLTLVLTACYGRRVLDSFVLGSYLYQGSDTRLYLTMDLFYAPCFVYGLVNLCGKGRLYSILEAIGKKSMTMWFLHCVFFNGSGSVFQSILYFPRNPVLVLIWGLLLCYGGAVVVDRIGKPLIRGKNKLLKW